MMIEERDFVGYSEQDLLKKTKGDTKENNKSIYLIARFIFDPAVREFFFLWYSYFRWVDDFSDSIRISTKERQSFLHRQKELVRRIYGYEQNDARGEELFLSLLISFDRPRGSKLKEPILSLLSCINHDIKRTREFPSQKERNFYIELESASLLKTFLYFCNPNANLNEIEVPELAIAAKWSHVLRDFISDIQNQTINISPEEILRFKIDNYQDVNDPGLREWVTDKVIYLKSKFIQGKRRLRRHPCLRFKIAGVAFCSKYEYYLYRIQKDHFRLRKEYKDNLIKECVTLIFFLKELLPISVTHPLLSLRSRYLRINTK